MKWFLIGLVSMFFLNGNVFAGNKEIIAFNKGERAGNLKWHSKYLKASENPNFGLENKKYDQLRIVVYISGNKGDFNLTENEVRTKVENKFRGSKINSDSDKGPFLDVSIVLVKSAFVVQLSYARQVYYFDEDLPFSNPKTKFNKLKLYGKPANTWERMTLGTGGGKPLLFNILDQQMDEFLNEYLKVNQK